MARSLKYFYYLHKEDINDLMNWFNSKMNQVIKENNLLQFDNEHNDIDTIVDHIYDKVKMALAWAEETPQQERAWFNMIMDRKYVLRKLIYNYIYKNFKYILK